MYEILNSYNIFIIFPYFEVSEQLDIHYIRMNDNTKRKLLYKKITNGT